jgi:hypothetical protein
VTQDDAISDRPSATDAGLSHLAELVAELVAPTSAGVTGPGAKQIVDALSTAGVAAIVVDEEDTGGYDLVVSVGAASASTLASARKYVDRLTAMASRAVVFAPSGDAERFPEWWDDLFAGQEFQAIDLLRAPLWEDTSWDVAVLTGLTLYVRSSQRSLIEALPSAAIPRSALHPGLVIAARRDRAAVRLLAGSLTSDTFIRNDPVAIVEGALAERARATTELEAELRQAETDAVALRLDAATAQAERIRADDARERAERALDCLRDRPDQLAEAAIAAPPRSSAGHRRRFAKEVGSTLGTRVESRVLGLFDRLSERAGPIGKLACRAATAYRLTTADQTAAADSLAPVRELFDDEYYLQQIPGLLGGDIDPVQHYLGGGWRRGYDPHPLFDTEWYLRSYLSILEADRSPIEHFASTGWREGFDPHPLFDVAWYLTHSPDVAAAGANPVVHYVRWGWREGRDPHPMFDTNWYRARYPDVEATGVCPLVHYVTCGWREGCEPSVLFDSAWYEANYPDVVASDLPPYRFYLDIGVRRGDHPCRWARDLHTDSEGSTGSAAS